jgi:hypothetical protein
MMALFWTLFQCDPPYAGWDPIRIAKEGKSFHCISDNIIGTTLSVIHVAMDFGLLSVPLIVLWKVRMSWGTRFRLYFVFSIGAMSFVGSVMRQVEQKKLAINDILCQPTSFRQGNLMLSYTGNFVAFENWILIDLTFGVVAASLPILSAIIPKSWQSIRGTHERSHTPYGTSGSGRQNMNDHSALFTRSQPKMSSTNRGFSDSMEKIIRTDVIELKFQNKSQFFGKTGNEASSSALDSNERRDHGGREGQYDDQDFSRVESFPTTDPRIWA